MQILKIENPDVRELMASNREAKQRDCRHRWEWLIGMAHCPKCGDERHGYDGLSAVTAQYYGDMFEAEANK